MWAQKPYGAAGLLLSLKSVDFRSLCAEVLSFPQIINYNYIKDIPILKYLILF